MSKYRVRLTNDDDIVIAADDVLIDDEGHLHLISGDPSTPHHNGLFIRGEFDYAVEVQE